MFIWLGSGRARRRSVGPPARLLDEAANAGLPVPAGAVVLDEFYRRALETGLAVANGRRVTIPDPELWHNTLHLSAHLPRFRRPVVVVPILAADGPAAVAGPRDLDFGDATAAAAAFAAAWSALAAAGRPRSDVLVMETVPAACAGSATTVAAADAPDDLVTLAGDGAALPLAQLRGRRGADRDLPPYARRLQQLLRGARRTFGPGVWRITWADDGRICWLTLVAAAAQEHVQQPDVAASA